jgi:hypothetical protein
VLFLDEVVLWEAIQAENVWRPPENFALSLPAIGFQ